MLVGIGYDVHRLGPGRPFILAGVQIPHELGLHGHSDADVVAHALMDALLGAAGLADIGTYFPDTDPAYKDADSMGLLKRVIELLQQEGYRPNNVDLSIICERPKLAPHMPAMKAQLAEALGLPLQRVGLKATTNEAIGFIGRGEGVAALAVVTLKGDA